MAFPWALFWGAVLAECVIGEKDLGLALISAAALVPWFGAFFLYRWLL